MVELEIGGTGSPAMLRLLHMKEGSIPQNIQVQFIHLMSKKTEHHDKKWRKNYSNSSEITR